MDKGRRRQGVWRRSLTVATVLLEMTLSGCTLSGGLFGGQAAKPGVTLEGRPVGRYTRSQIEPVVDEIARDHEQPVKLARLDPRTGRAYPGASGRRLDREATVRRVMDANPKARVRAVTVELEPPLDVADFSADPASVAHLKVVTHFATPILDARPSRLHNLEIASRRLTGVQVRPGAVFSFNGLVGADPGPADGYLPAPVIDDNGRKVPDYGGGLCQVSTTIYNAVLAARLPVVERHPHSKPVSYAPKGRDATVYTDKDFRFRNSRKYPLYLLVRTNKAAVRVYLVRSSRDRAAR